MLAAMILVAVVLLVFGFPLYLVFLVGSLVALVGFMDIPLTMVVQTMFDSMNTTVLLAVPYFILAGDIMSRGQMTTQMVSFFRSLLGRLPGSLGVVTVVSSAFFGAISGSSPAAVATIGKVMYPAMLKDNYGQRFTSGLITSAGNLAIIIPPSITMILYSSVTNASVGKLFMGGVIPGLLLVGMLSAYIIYYARSHGMGQEEGFSWQQLWATSKTSIPTLLMPIIVLGSIYLGVCTPTEAAIISVFYALAVTFTFNRDFHLQDLWASLKESAKLTAQILVIMSAASVFSLVLTLGQVPQQITDLLNAYQISPVVFLVIVNVLLLIVGMFLDSASAIVALLPLLAPVVAAQGIDLIHFGLVITLNLAIGMCTPPFGLNLFTTLALFKVDLKELVRGLLPFLVIFLVALVLVTYVPDLVLWLPNLMD